MAAYKHLRAGNGAYWNIHHSTRNGQTYIIISSLYKVASYLDAGLTKGAHFVEIKIADLPPSSRTQARRAILYNLFDMLCRIVHIVSTVTTI